MSDATNIEWTDATWNPTTGCDKVSPGCDNCYAMTLAPRLKAMRSPHYQRDGDPKTSSPGFGVSIHPDALDKPLRWKKPRRIFVNSMSDLFHDEIPDEFIAQVFAVMALAPQHTFQVLTKRHGRMRSLLNNADWRHRLRVAVHNMLAERIEDYRAGRLPASWTWPLPKDDPCMPTGRAHLRDQCNEAGVGGESGRGARPQSPALGDRRHGEHGTPMHKKAAGRVLDGRTWDEEPGVA